MLNNGTNLQTFSENDDFRSSFYTSFNKDREERMI